MIDRNGFIRWRSPSGQINIDIDHTSTAITTPNSSIYVSRSYNDDGDEQFWFSAKWFGYGVTYYWVCSPRYYYLGFGG